MQGNKRNNPWHSIDYHPDSPKIINTVIEINKGEHGKYELHKDSGILMLDRVLHSAVYYPQNYGFIPKTYWEDDDPLDVLVMCSIPIKSMCLVEAKVIGGLLMYDGNESDDKIIAVCNNDPSVSFYNNLDEVPKHLVKEIERFFMEYKNLEGKKTSVD